MEIICIVDKKSRPVLDLEEKFDQNLVAVSTLIFLFLKVTRNKKPIIISQLQCV